MNGVPVVVCPDGHVHVAAPCPCGCGPLRPTPAVIDPVPQVPKGIIDNCTFTNITGGSSIGLFGNGLIVVQDAYNAAY